MTVLTDDGIAYLNDLRFGRETDPIDTVAVGVGTAPESFVDSTLANEVYRSSVTNNNVRFVPDPDTPTSATIGAIDLQGGLEVPAETDITEIGFVVGPQNILVGRDVMSAVTIPNGIERTLQMRMHLGRI